MAENERPDPDSLLARVQEEEERARRGKLRVFFGFCAGVGKTFAMLSAARQLRAQGLDVVVGIAETHGRAETQVLLDGLEQLPLKAIEYRGRALHEFDLDAALARKPALILVDELAHTNAPGSRHPKRWQDVDELLGAGIDVFTTVNVQHLETLNDVVGSITGIRVWETVPDHVFDEAGDVVLVDITPDELLRRLREGKVYMPEQTKHAIRNFFRKGNLIALRELALRRTADRVDEEMRAYRRAESVQSVWQTRDSLMVCVGSSPGSERAVRTAARLAVQLDAPWQAVYVETPRLQRLPDASREGILQTLKLAKELGAETVTLPGEDAAEVVVAYARDHNLTKVVVGRDHEADFWRRSFAERLGRLAPDLDVIQVAREPRPAPRGGRTAFLFSTQTPWSSYAWSAGACAAATVLATPLSNTLELTNIVMIYLLVVVGVALRLGRGPAVLAAFLSVGFFDFFFVPPRLSFAVSDVQYLVTFGVMLTVALVIGQLMANLRYQAKVSMSREGRARALYEAARDLSAALLPQQVAEICDRFCTRVFGAKAAIILPDAQGRLREATCGESGALSVDNGIAQWAFDHGEAAGLGTDTLVGSPVFYMPLKAPMRTRGVLAIEPPQGDWLQMPEQRRLMDTFSTLVAIAIERVHYVEVAQDAVVKMESERLRNSVLSVLSHDLRTPLTALVGLSDTLALQPLTESQMEMASAIRDEATRMGALVNNLLDMARLQSGEVKLNRQWQAVEEVVGSAIKASSAALTGRKVSADLPDDLPLVEFDAVLIERVLCNLLENAGKYTPAGTPVTIRGTLAERFLEVSVCDEGPGLPRGHEESLFDKFTRGQAESRVPGIGLGLAICRAIVEAHGGRIRAENVDPHGACFTFSLPLGTPPELKLPEEM
jgi:two-component system sensor histidine kinase KdpD